jgi:tRNA C32,U32 (ribose-2'-O)-methylase TrmJ
MDLIEKYLGEAKYIPNMKYWPDEEIRDYKSAAEDFIQLAKISDHLPAKMRDVTASVGFHMRKNDKRKVKQLLDKYSDQIIGGTGTINQLRNWVRS